MDEKNKKVIYRNFKHWFTTSTVHGFSSASRDFAEELWNDFEPTINANLDDHKRAYIELCNKRAKRDSELLDALLEYIKIIEGTEKTHFWKWRLDREMKRVK